MFSSFSIQANIFIDDHWGVRIADFGLAIFSEATLTAHTLNGKGTMRWMGPELHFPEKFGLDICTQTYATDVYALACTFVEVIILAPIIYHSHSLTSNAGFYTYSTIFAYTQ